MNISNVVKIILSKIKSHLFFIILLVCFSVVSTGIISYYFVSPVYQASTDIIIHQKELEEEQSIGVGLQESINFVPTYREIINSSQLLEQLIDEGSLDMTADQLREKITIIASGNSQLITIAVTDENPDVAAGIANNLVFLSQAKIRQLLNLDNIIILAPAAAGEKISGNATSLIISVAAAAMMALICGTGFAFILDYFDQTIKDEQDILDVLGIPFLGAVSPYFELEEEKEVFQKIVLKNKEA